MKTRTIRRTMSLHAGACEVYEMLMDEKKHALLTGGSARISRDAGGTFVTNDGYHMASTGNWYRTKKLSRPGVPVTGLTVIIQR